MNTSKSSKSRILLSLIDSFQKSPEEILKQEKAKNLIIFMIESKFNTSQQTYKFPRTIEEQQIDYKENKKSFDKNHLNTSTSNLKNLMKNIYQPKTLQFESRHKEFLKQQFSKVPQQSRSVKNSQIKKEISLIIKTVDTKTHLQQLKQVQKLHINNQIQRFIEAQKQNVLHTTSQMKLKKMKEISQICKTEESFKNY